MADASESTHVNLRAPNQGGTRIHLVTVKSKREYGTPCGRWFYRWDCILTADAPTCLRCAAIDALAHPLARSPLESRAARRG